VALGDEPIARESLGAALDKATGSDRDQRVFVRADKNVAYGDIMGMMNLLRGAGYLKIGLVGLEAAQTGGPAPAEPHP